MKSFNDRLVEAGVALSARQAVARVRKLAVRMFPDYTDEEILLRPAECALHLVAAIREALGSARLPEDLALRLLTARRKQKKAYAS